jgi:tetratricopeptide (TPR) repeat protein
MPAAADDAAKRTFDRALDLVHAYSGSGDQLDRAMKMAEELSKSAPKSGYAQVLYAEALSTWHLRQDGNPLEVRNQVIQIADQAIGLNPQLAQAYVSKGRALVRSSMYAPAAAAIDKALSIDPSLSGAMFLRAEIYRRTLDVAEAEIWYHKFIDAAPSASRKANGYNWLATMYETIESAPAVADRAPWTAKARAAHEAALRLDPGGAWRIVNFAIFLNGYAADFDAAERQARKALDLMEFPMARYHLAAARYQKLAAWAANASPEALGAEAAEIAASTRVSLQQALAFPSFASVVRERLARLQERLPSRSNTGAARERRA